MGLAADRRFPTEPLSFRLRRSLLLLFFVGLSFGQSPATPLRVAAFKTDITPPPGTQLWGFSNRRSPATGTLDPLFARVLVLEAGGKLDLESLRAWSQDRMAKYKIPREFVVLPEMPRNAMGKIVRGEL